MTGAQGGLAIRTTALATRRQSGKAGAMRASVHRFAGVVLALAAAQVASPAVGGQGKTPAYVPPLVRPAGATGTVVVPDRFLRRWDPVTVFFARDIGPAKGGPEDRA